jgi:hypothetical protein
MTWWIKAGLASMLIPFVVVLLFIVLFMEGCGRTLANLQDFFELIARLP